VEINKNRYEALENLEAEIRESQENFIGTKDTPMNEVEEKDTPPKIHFISSRGKGDPSPVKITTRMKSEILVILKEGSLEDSLDKSERDFSHNAKGKKLGSGSNRNIREVEVDHDK